MKSVISGRRTISRLRIIQRRILVRSKGQQDVRATGNAGSDRQCRARTGFCGFEINIDAIVTEHLALNAAVTGEHGWYAKLSSVLPGFEPAPPAATWPLTFDATGKTMARTPKWSGVIPVGGGHARGADGAIREQLPSACAARLVPCGHGGASTLNRLVSNGPRTYQPAYGYSIARSRIETFGDHVLWTGWVKNALDRLYENDRLYNTFGTVVQDAPRVQFGLTATYHY